MLFLKTDVNVPTVNNKQKNLREKNLYCLRIYKATEEKSRIRIRNPVGAGRGLDPDRHESERWYPDLDSHQRDADPQHCL
jgi:hypothetical protein